jgi:hypothetical protein
VSTHPDSIVLPSIDHHRVLSFARESGRTIALTLYDGNVAVSHEGHFARLYPASHLDEYLDTKSRHASTLEFGVQETVFDKGPKLCNLRT